MSGLLALFDTSKLLHAIGRQQGIHEVSVIRETEDDVSNKTIKEERSRPTDQSGGVQQQDKMSFEPLASDW